MSNMGIFFGHWERWPLIILIVFMVALMVHASKIRNKVLQRLGLLQKTGAFEKPVNRPFKNILFIAGVLSCFVALLAPQWGQKAHTFKAQGLDICFAMDLSKSMLAEDVAPSRLVSAKNQLNIFLPRLGGDRAAIVGFAGSGFVAAPLSVDHASLGAFLEPLHPEYMSNTSTNLASGIDACLTALDVDQVKTRDEILDAAAKLIVLITDGEDTVDDFKDAIGRCEKLGIPVYSFAQGTLKGGPIALRDANGRLEGYLKSPGSGQPVLSQLKDTALKDIAKRTGAKVFYGAEGIEAWKSFEAAIQNYKRDSRDAGTMLDREDRFQWPLLLAFIFLLLDFFISETKIRWGLGLVFFLLSAVPARANQDPGVVFHNHKALDAFNQKDFGQALEQYQQALGRDARDAVSRFNWATTKFFSAIDPMAKDPEKQINKKVVEEAVKELEFLNKENSAPTSFKKALEYQLAQGYEMLSLPAQALDQYYAALTHDPEKVFDQKIKNSIARLLTQQEQNGGGGGGGGGGQDDKKDKKDPKPDGQNQPKPEPGADAPQGRQKPKFTGTDISEEQAKQILESVSGEEGEVLKRRARDEAKERAMKKEQRGEAEDLNANPW